MSGPKDYVYALSEVRRAAMRLRRDLEARARQTETLARLAAQRETAQQKAKLAAQKRAQVLQQLARENEIIKAGQPTAPRQPTRQSMPTAGSEAAAAVGELPDSSLTPTVPVVDEVPESVTASVTYDDSDSRELDRLVQELHPWQAELEADASVGFYQGAERTIWQRRFSQLLSAHEDGKLSAELRPAAEALLVKAQAIHSQAGEIQARFATRNELLSDMIGALQEIGFYVADPHFENPADPGGPVLLKATRGSETMEASVDLSDTIRSVWNGLPDQHCKDAFFDYVDQLQQKGISVTALRNDLRSRPELKQKGAQELPRPTQRNQERG